MKILTCTICPKECVLNISINNNIVEKIEGNECKRGVNYAEMELKHPKRILTTTVLINNNNDNQVLLPVRSSNPISKELMLKAMDIINKTCVNTPIKMGDVIIKNILNTGIDIIASKSIPNI